MAKNHFLDLALGVVRNVAKKAATAAVESVLDEAQDGLRHVNAKISVARQRAQAKRPKREKPVIDVELNDEPRTPRPH